MWFWVTSMLTSVTCFYVMTSRMGLYEVEDDTEEVLLGIALAAAASLLAGLIWPLTVAVAGLFYVGKMFHTKEGVR